MRFLGNFGLILALIVVLLSIAGINGLGLDVPLPTSLTHLLPGSAQSEQVVEGKATRIPLAPDGHFWVKARINGTPHRFLIDTGATLTTLSPNTARDAGLVSDKAEKPIELHTANGMAEGAMASIDELRVGNIVARHLQAVVAPGLGETNVLGMNFLTRLDSWRVQGKVMVLVPHHPLAEASDQP